MLESLRRRAVVLATSPSLDVAYSALFRKGDAR
jgi:hypothetical protein